MFAAHGLSAAQISTLFVLWSGASAVLQIPAGAVADRISRPKLLAVASALRGVGFGLWVFAPSYPAFAAGFLLWSAKGALTSGTLEALVYDELALAGETDRYTALTGRAGAVRGALSLAATALAAPVLAVGGYHLVGLASVAVCAAQIPVALTFPEAPRVADDDEPVGFTAYLRTLRAGVTEVLRRTELRRLVLVAGFGGLLAVDEYLPLLARQYGVAAADIPYLLLVPTLAGIAASALVGTGRKVGIAAPLVVAGVLLGLGALTASAVGIVAAGIGLGSFQLGQLMVEARIQHAVAGRARATVASVSEVLAEAGALLVFAGFGVAADSLGLRRLMLIDALLVVAVAAYAGLVLRERRRRQARTAKNP